MIIKMSYFYFNIKLGINDESSKYLKQDYRNI